jgi:hypothetical protein
VGDDPLPSLRAPDATTRFHNSDSVVGQTHHRGERLGGGGPWEAPVRRVEGSEVFEGGRFGKRGVGDRGARRGRVVESVVAALVAVCRAYR